MNKLISTGAKLVDDKIGIPERNPDSKWKNLMGNEDRGINQEAATTSEITK